MKKDFGNFLMEKHAEQYVGTDDMMVDAFNDWLEDLSSDDWIHYGDLFGVERAIKATDRAIEILKEIEK